MSSFDLNAAAEPRSTAVLLHPHPDYGGNRWHPVIDALYRGLPALGVHAIRFDFSSSEAATATAEVGQALTRAPTLPIVVIGYSFGAGIAAGIDDRSVAGWFLVAPPLALIDASTAAAGRDDRPTAVLVPERDQYSSPQAVGSAVASWRRTTVAVVAGADHFLVGRSKDVLAACAAWLVPGQEWASAS